jgi:tetratricopeptide (TPR) repeat protein
MGWAYAQMGKSSDAEKAFRKSSETSKDSYAPADIGLGTLLLDTKRVLEGESALHHALELDAKSWRAYYELGRASLMENKIEDALKNALQAKTLQPKAPAVYKLLAIIHIKQNNGTDLLDDLDSYIQLDPKSPAGQRAKELRDQVAKMLPAKAPNPANQGTPTNEPAPTLKKTETGTSPQDSSTPASPN